MLRGSNSAETADRLLAAASEVFAEVGYRATTLREICRLAKANVAAVNYHFRDKQRLYTAVIQQAVGAAGESLLLIAPQPADPPEQQLQHFVHKFLQNLLGSERPVQLLRLVAHEMIEPTPTLDVVVEKAVRPIREILEKIVVELLFPGADAVLIRDCALSILSQCADYYHCEALIQRADHIDVHDTTTIEHLAEHIFRFSLGGIRAVGEQAKQADCPRAMQGRR